MSRILSNETHTSSGEPFMSPAITATSRISGSTIITRQSPMRSRRRMMWPCLIVVCSSPRTAFTVPLFGKSFSKGHSQKFPTTLCEAFVGVKLLASGLHQTDPLFEDALDLFCVLVALFEPKVVKGVPDGVVGVGSSSLPQIGDLKDRVVDARLHRRNLCNELHALTLAEFLQGTDHLGCGERAPLRQPSLWFEVLHDHHVRLVRQAEGQDLGPLAPLPRLDERDRCVYDAVPCESTWVDGGHTQNRQPPSSTTSIALLTLHCQETCPAK